MKNNKENRPTVHKFRHLKGWNDVDYKMLHACFDFLCDFVEKEKGQESLDYQVKSMLELPKETRIQRYKDKNKFDSMVRLLRKDANNCRELYRWWNDVYLPKWKDGSWDALYGKEGIEEQKMFLRLIKIRRCLWT